MQIKDLIPWSRRDPEVVRQSAQDDPIATLQREVNRIFDGFWSRFDGGPVTGERGVALAAPRTDVVETDEAVEVSVELPGMEQKDVDVSVTEDVLIVKGEKKAERTEEKKGYHLAERSYGSFYRTIPLPPGVATDGAEAEFRNGVLTISLPKTSEDQAKVKKIAVKAS